MAFGTAGKTRTLEALGKVPEQSLASMLSERLANMELYPPRSFCFQCSRSDGVVNDLFALMQEADQHPGLLEEMQQQMQNNLDQRLSL